VATVAYKKALLLSEDERLEMLRLRSQEMALEMFVASGSANVQYTHVMKYEKVLQEINEFKREILLDAGEINEDMFDFSFFFDSVSGYVFVEEEMQ
jgi:mevalonate kinase